MKKVLALGLVGGLLVSSATGTYAEYGNRRVRRRRPMRTTVSVPKTSALLPLDDRLNIDDLICLAKLIISKEERVERIYEALSVKVILQELKESGNYTHKDLKLFLLRLNKLID